MFSRTPHRASSFARQVATWAHGRLGEALIRWDGPRLHDPEALPSPNVKSDVAQLDYVVDPDDTVWLFRITGRASLRTVDELDRITTDLGARHTVHVDLHDADIPSETVMRDLERLADRLERARVRVRMVGVDPNHPALDPRR
jgi:hypothetical protein